ncbi:MAG: patatin-like phospholipase family protein [Kiritimatiellia bacterium]|nr:patatin-like phospholipase family protein [Lentisphaerota bacterium]
MRLNKILSRKRPKVALVLGSGAARGWAHLGVLEELRRVGLPIDMVVGASMGALVGAVYAAGRWEALRDVACGLDWRQMISYFIELSFPRSGLIDGAKVEAFVREHVNFAAMEELDLPFRAVATDIVSGNEFVFERGDVVTAVRASIAVPGMFTPVAMDGRVLVDGGLVNPVPVSVARAMGADFVVAVDVNGYHTPQAMGEKQDPPPGPSGDTAEALARLVKTVKARVAGNGTPWGRLVTRWLKAAEMPGIFDVLGNSIRIMEAQITAARFQIDPPDLLIRPRLGDISFMDFHRAEPIMAAGRQATADALRGVTTLRALIRKAGREHGALHTGR